MKIKEITGDLLTVERGIIVHGCNAQGVMGSGVAAAIRSRFPGAYEAYRRAYLQHGLKLGQVVGHTVRTDPEGRPSLVIANAITQEHYGRKTGHLYVSYPAVSECFKLIAAKARTLQLDVHFPLIGCGLGGGDWDEVAHRIEAELGDVPATLWRIA